MMNRRYSVYEFVKVNDFQGILGRLLNYLSKDKWIVLLVVLFLIIIVLIIVFMLILFGKLLILIEFIWFGIDV